MWSAIEIEDFLHSSQMIEPSTKPLSPDVISGCLQLFEVANTDIATAIEFSLQRQAANHLMARQLFGGRTGAAIARRKFGDLILQANKLIGALEDVNIIMRLPLTERFEDLQREHRTVLVLVEFEERLKLFRDAVMIAVAPVDRRGNKSDSCLEVAAGALMFFMQSVLEPARTPGPSQNGRPHFTLARQAKIIRCFLVAVEPDQAARYSISYIEYLMRKIRKAYPGEKLARFAPVLMSGL